MNERALAVQYVTDLIGRWQSASAHGQAARGIARHVVELKREIGAMQAAGPDGERRARTWCLVAGLA